MKLAPSDKGSKMGETIKVNPFKGVIPSSSNRAPYVYSDYDGDDLDELLARHGPEPVRR